MYLRQHTHTNIATTHTPWRTQKFLNVRISIPDAPGRSIHANLFEFPKPNQRVFWALPFSKKHHEQGASSHETGCQDISFGALPLKASSK